MNTVTVNLMPIIDRITHQVYKEYDYVMFNKAAALIVGHYIDIFKMAPQERCISYLEYRLNVCYEIIKVVANISSVFIEALHLDLGTSPNDYIEHELIIHDHNDIHIKVTNYGDVLNNVNLGTRWFERYVNSLTLDDITE